MCNHADDKRDQVWLSFARCELDAAGPDAAAAVYAEADGHFAECALKEERVMVRRRDGQNSSQKSRSRSCMTYSSASLNRCSRRGARWRARAATRSA